MVYIEHIQLGCKGSPSFSYIVILGGQPQPANCASCRSNVRAPLAAKLNVFNTHSTSQVILQVHTTV